MRYGKLVIGLIFIITIAAIIAIAPLFFFWTSRDPVTHVFKLGDYGAWLQGALTPFVLMVALVAVFIQIKSFQSTLGAQKDAYNAQKDANRKLLMGIMLDNLERFQWHLNYLASVYHYKEYRRGDSIDKRRLYYINFLLKPEVTNLETGEYADNLKRDLRTIISLAEESNTLSFLDGRIIELYRKINDVSNS